MINHLCIYQQVAQKSLSKIDFEDEQRSYVVDVCKYFHVSSASLSKKFYSKLGRHTYVTPTSYLQLIAGFMNIITSKQQQVL
jgi:dynein heavy chain